MKAHQYVMKQYETPTQCMFIVSSGKIDAWVEGRGKVCTYERGDYFGERALVDPQPRGASLRGGDYKSIIVQLW